MRPGKLLSLLWVGVIFLLLSACGSLMSSDEPAERTFLLKPYMPSRMTGDSVEQKGLVFEFSVIPGLDSDRLQTVSPDLELRPISAARWPDHLPEFANSLIERSLLGTGWYTRVSDWRHSSHSDCQLELVAQEFNALLDRSGSVSSVRISMAGSFACNGSVMQLNLQEENRVTGQQVTDVVAAFQRTLDDVTRTLLEKLDQA